MLHYTEILTLCVTLILVKLPLGIVTFRKGQYHGGRRGRPSRLLHIDNFYAAIVIYRIESAMCYCRLSPTVGRNRLPCLCLAPSSLCPKAINGYFYIHLSVIDYKYFYVVFILFQQLNQLENNHFLLRQQIFVCYFYYFFS